ncbi:MAG: dTDP-4-dehydrorhamnose 3,5-epimerase family protein [Candidatus Eremiobacteraeota bacterium]|nr:dTDP-4-dehydrorhamnose 3,5-epimerase family protein [Candidatus Eremiobacteraeota bacterium]
MKLTPTRLPGTFRIACARFEDTRGAFVKCFDATAFRSAGLNVSFEQMAVAENRLRGTVRGMHYQAAPHEEIKIVRCTRGSIFDVLVDVRPDSETYGQWEAFTLSALVDEELYVAPGIAHGYQTLEDDTVVEYLISAPFVEALQRGIHWKSPRLKIAWPLDVTSISPRDDAFEAFE